MPMSTEECENSEDQTLHPLEVPTSHNTLQNSLNNETGSARLIKRESADAIDHSDNAPLKRMLLSFNTAVNKRLDNIETKLEFVTDFCTSLESKLDNLSVLVKEKSSQLFINNTVSLTSEDSNPSSLTMAGTNLTLITLNSEADFPDGSWLGDETNPELRVRCNISPADMFHISANCRSAEKMALTLLDYLFDRETQARSNISGYGKHKKERLDPLMVYGIQCHLKHNFKLDRKSWSKIKQNLDSKCRTAFRRKQRGLPLFPIRTGSGCQGNEDSENSIHDEESLPDEQFTESLSLECVNDPNDFASLMSDGQIQVVHATPEQLAQIRNLSQYQIVSSDNMLTLVERSKFGDGGNSSNEENEQRNESCDSDK